MSVFIVLQNRRSERFIKRKGLRLPDHARLKGQIHIGRIFINVGLFSGISKGIFASQAFFWLPLWEIQLHLCFSSLFWFLPSVCTWWNKFFPFRQDTCSTWRLFQEVWMHTEGSHDKTGKLLSLLYNESYCPLFLKDQDRKCCSENKKSREVMQHIITS